MGETLFDPETGEVLDEARASNVNEFSVSEISGQLKRLVEDTFGRVRVRGEIAGYRGPHSSGHMYFALKDDRARLEAVVWRGVANRLKHLPEEGMEVVATGKLSTYPGTSKYQIIIDAIEPAGAGALMALLEQRKKKLEAEGLFAAERKRQLPYLPSVVGVVTSPTGAVIRDILHRIMDRFPLTVLVWPVRVQGETTGAEVAAAIEGFNALEGDLPKPDVLIVARGGGSIEDLWGFNDEAVVRAAAGSTIPLVSAVGHETDWTLIDLAADVRAPTPTGAAEFVVPVKADLEAHLATLRARLGSANSRAMENRRTALKAALRGLPAPDSLFEIQNQRLDAAAGRLASGLITAVQRKANGFERSAARMAPNLLLVPIRQRKERTIHQASRLTQALGASVERRRARLDSIRLHSGLLATPVREARGKLHYAGQAIDGSQSRRLERLAERVDKAARLLVSYSHQKTLERGFAIVRNAKGQVVGACADIAQKQEHTVTFRDGDARFLHMGSDGSALDAALKKKSANTSKSAQRDGKADDQADLF